MSIKEKLNFYTHAFFYNKAYRRVLVTLFVLIVSAYALSLNKTVGPETINLVLPEMENLNPENDVNPSFSGPGISDQNESDFYGKIQGMLLFTGSVFLVLILQNYMQNIDTSTVVDLTIELSRSGVLENTPEFVDDFVLSGNGLISIGDSVVEPDNLYLRAEEVSEQLANIVMETRDPIDNLKSFYETALNDTTISSLTDPDFMLQHINFFQSCILKVSEFGGLHNYLCHVSPDLINAYNGYISRGGDPAKFFEWVQSVKTV